MKAFLIDPKAKNITEIDFDKSDYRNINEILGCRCFTVTWINTGTTDEVFVDDEGLLSEDTPLYSFQFLGGHQPLVGRGLVLGAPDSNGETTPATLTLEKLQEITRFGVI